MKSDIPLRGNPASQCVRITISSTSHPEKPAGKASSAMVFLALTGASKPLLGLEWFGSCIPLCPIRLAQRLPAGLSALLLRPSPQRLRALPRALGRHLCPFTICQFHSSCGLFVTFPLPGRILLVSKYRALAWAIPISGTMQAPSA